MAFERPLFRLASWALISAACFWLFGAVAFAQSQPSVDTKFGEVIGRSKDGIDTFLGIPFAPSTAGEGRFMPPGAPPIWNTPLEATSFGPACPSVDPTRGNVRIENSSEDCLSLNIWRPEGDTRDLPVMVWIHGGGYQFGSARTEVINGARLARRGNMIVVTIQYRLGILGWMDLTHLGGDAYRTSGNNGVLDQIAALRWINRNISAFGGDPENVTIFGESAGAVSVGTLLNTKLARGLFARGIIQSGHPFILTTKEESAFVTRSIMEEGGLETVADLKALSAEEILDLQTSYLSGPGQAYTLGSFLPSLDGEILTEFYGESLADPGFTPVPVMIGTNRDEFRNWAHLNGIARLPFEFFKPWLDALTDGRSAAVYDAYKSERPGLSDGEFGMAVMGDALFRMPSVRLAEKMSANGHPVWMYLFEFDTNVPGSKVGSPHAMDIPIVFGNLDAPQTRQHHILVTEENRKSLQQFSDRVQDAWIAFAHSGDPSTASLGNWPSYDTQARATMVLNLESEVVKDPVRAERRIWDGVAFDGAHPTAHHSQPTSHPDTKVTLRTIMAVIGPTRLVLWGLGILLVVLIGAWALRQWLFARKEAAT